jgi:hypothetical protein
MCVERSPSITITKLKSKGRARSLGGHFKRSIMATTCVEKVDESAMSTKALAGNREFAGACLERVDTILLS